MGTCETGASGNRQTSSPKSDFREKETKEAKPCDVPAHFPGSLSFRMARMYTDRVGQPLWEERAKFSVHGDQGT